MREFLTAIMVEGFGRLFGDFLECFQTVGNEAGVEDGDTLGAVPGEALHRLVRIGLQPFLRAETGLEGDDELIVGKTELFTQQAAGLDALGVIGVTLFRVGKRDAVEGGEDLSGNQSSVARCRVMDLASASI